MVSNINVLSTKISKDMCPVTVSIYYHSDAANHCMSHGKSFSFVQSKHMYVYDDSESPNRLTLMIFPSIFENHLPTDDLSKEKCC